MKKRRNKYFQKGLAQLPLILGLLLIGIALPAAIRLLQESQDTRKDAALDAPCKVCTGHISTSVCQEIATIPHCSPDLNECTYDTDCRPATPTPAPASCGTHPDESRYCVRDRIYECDNGVERLIRTCSTNCAYDQDDEPYCVIFPTNTPTITPTVTPSACVPNGGGCGEDSACCSNACVVGRCIGATPTPTPKPCPAGYTCRDLFCYADEIEHSMGLGACELYTVAGNKKFDAHCCRPRATATPTPTTPCIEDGTKCGAPGSYGACELCCSGTTYQIGTYTYCGIRPTPTITPTPTCVPDGGGCSGHSACCSNLCVVNRCVRATPTPTPTPTPTTRPTPTPVGCDPGYSCKQSPCVSGLEIGNGEWCTYPGTWNNEPNGHCCRPVPTATPTPTTPCIEDGTKCGAPGSYGACELCCSGTTYQIGTYTYCGVRPTSTPTPDGFCRTAGGAEGTCLNPCPDGTIPMSSVNCGLFQNCCVTSLPTPTPTATPTPDNFCRTAGGDEGFCSAAFSPCPAGTVAMSSVNCGLFKNCCVPISPTVIPTPTVQLTATPTVSPGTPTPTITCLPKGSTGRCGTLNCCGWEEVIDVPGDICQCVDRITPTATPTPPSWTCDTYCVAGSVQCQIPGVGTCPDGLFCCDQPKVSTTPMPTATPTTGQNTPTPTTSPGTPTATPTSIATVAPTVTPTTPPVPTEPPSTPKPECPYQTLQARVQLDSATPWVQNLTLRRGQPVNMACMYNQSGQLANNVQIVLDGPAGQEWNDSHVNQWVPEQEGGYRVYCYSTQSDCNELNSGSDSATLSVAGCKPCADGTYAPMGTTSYSCRTDGAQIDDFIGWREQYLGTAPIPADEIYGDYDCSGQVGIEDFILWREKYLAGPLPSPTVPMPSPTGFISPTATPQPTVPVPTNTPAPGGAVVSMVPQTRTINQGSETTISFDVANIADLYGFQVDVVFNDMMLDYVSFSGGDFMSQPGDQNVPFWVNPKVSSGRLDEIAVVRVNPDGPISGTGTIFSVTFSGEAMGTTDITIENAAFSDMQGNIIPVQIDGGQIQVVTQ